MALTQPRKEAHRKVRKGKNAGTASRCNYVAFGEFGLMSLDNERINGRQIEAARQAITRYVKRGGKIWIRIFPHIPVTKKPLDVKMVSRYRNVRNCRCYRSTGSRSSSPRFP